MVGSVNAIRVNANLRGKPAIIVQGRADALVPINHASRPYLGANRVAEGNNSQLSLYEITNGQHFDAFLSVAGFDTRFIPVHYYNIQALNLMWNHLKNNAPLPPSQVVRTVARGGAAGSAPALTTSNLPPIATDPGANAITTAGGIVNVPN
jgi:hydroxybutyrate-dimer hydrolase